MENKYRDPESKNKIKQLKNDAQKQIDRNRVILKDLINKYPYIESGPSLRDRSASSTSSKTARTTCWADG